MGAVHWHHVAAVARLRAEACELIAPHLETLDALNDNKYSRSSVRYDLELVRQFCLNRTGESRELTD